LLYVAALVPHINEKISVYGLPATPADEPQLQTVAGMATRMVQMIRSVQPRGPYRIAGWSFGGILAYEIATQLIRAQQEVSFLGLLDAYYSPGIGKLRNLIDSDVDDKEKLLRLVRSENPDEKLQATIDAIESISATMDYATLVQKCNDNLLIPKLLSGLKAKQIRDFLARSQSIGSSGALYSAQAIPIRVHLFAAQESSATTNHDRGWDLVVPDNQLSIIPVAGTHHSMMASPNVQFLGQTLSQVICSATTDLARLEI
jgi:thioesterase domain-containing protein